MLTIATATFDGPFVKFAVSVTVPATVPVSSMTGEVNTAVVLLAGMVKLTVRDPVEN